MGRFAQASSAFAAAPPDGLFPDCAPNGCVSSQDDRPAAWDNPWEYDGDAASAQTRLVAALTSGDGTRTFAELSLRPAVELYVAESKRKEEEASKGMQSVPEESARGERSSSGESEKGECEGSLHIFKVDAMRSGSIVGTLIGRIYIGKFQASTPMEHRVTEARRFINDKTSEIA